MKVLILNTYYYNRGGDTTYSFNLAELLRQHGHTVRFFSMKHPLNFQTDDSRFFVDYIDFVEANFQSNITTGIKVLKRSIYSIHARYKIREMLDEYRPDIAHVQNIHTHITPSVLFELKQRNIPIVWTLHDYKFICPNATLLEHGNICEACKGEKFYRAIVYRCKKNSLPASVIASLEAYIHKLLDVKKLVSVFISPSDFLRNKFIEFGWPANSIVTVHNFLTDDQFFPLEQENRNYILFLGRVEEIKGIRTLITAVSELQQVLLKVAGDGELRRELETMCIENGFSNIEFLGRLEKSAVKDVVQKCAFVVVPSEWYENYPFSIMEVMAMGKAVLASDVGGIPELVKENVTGMLFKPGNITELKQKLILMLKSKELCNTLGANARALVESVNNKKIHFEEIMKIYSQAQQAAQI